MKKNGLISAFVLLGLIMAGCSYDEGPIPSEENPLNSQGEAALKGAKKHPVPFKSKFVCRSIDFYQNEGEDFWHQVLEGEGNATHMGKTTLNIPDELLYPDAAWYNWTATADVILTAANGDELHFSYASAFIYVLPVHVIGEGPITGGTGRFGNATGWMIYEGNWPDNTGEVTFTGEIQY
jgi:hypothetical protein